MVVHIWVMNFKLEIVLYPSFSVGVSIWILKAWMAQTRQVYYEMSGVHISLHWGRVANWKPPGAAEKLK